MSSIVELLKTAMVVGTLYTLTGPNLAALATLSGTDIINRRDYDSDDHRKKKKRKVETFLLGIRWGIGNSIGILLVGGILISLQPNDPSGDWVWMDYWLRTMLQAFVGVFLLILGTYGLIKALRNREFSMGNKDLEFKKSSVDSCSSVGLESAITEIVVNRIFDDGNEELSSDSDSSPRQQQHVPMQRRPTTDSIVDQMVTCLDASGRSVDVDVEETLGLSEFDLRMWKAAKALTDNMMLYADDDWSFGSKSVEASIKTIEMGGDTRKNASTDFIGSATMAVLTKEDDNKKPVTRFDSSKCSDSSSLQRSNNLLRNMTRRGSCLYCTPAVLAVFAGIVHGLSGPGEVLGVIPAVQLKQVHLAVLYLSTFCVSSTLVMGGFAASYGSLCKWLVKRAGSKDEDASLSRVFLVEFGSACLSIVVGIVWLTLLAVGQLDIMAP
jgi:hypothetical protein